ncbi:hypothetical protein [Methanoregula sp.]|uniref:hypothetical protein n=1 Tax=Methanoregula sp. TaxID=2052170 RepID=UPI0035650B70
MPPELFYKPHPFKEQSITVTLRRNTDDSSNYLYEIIHKSDSSKHYERFDTQESAEKAIMKINSEIRNIIVDMRNNEIEEEALTKQARDKIIADNKEEKYL